MKRKGIRQIRVTASFFAMLVLIVSSGMAFGEPVGSITINNNAPYTKSASVNLIISATDSGGMAQMCISNTTDCSSWIKYKTKMKWKLPAGDGLKTVYAWFKNREGVTNTIAYFDSITLDTSPPSGNLTATANEFQISLDWSDFVDTTSGISGYSLVFDNKKAVNKCGTKGVLYTGDNTSFVHTNLDARKTYHYLVCATDNAGNTSSVPKASAIPLDNAPPAGYVVINTNFSKKSFSTNLAISATDPSGVTQMCVSNTPSCSSWIKYKTKMKWTLPGGDGLKTVYIWFKDGVGNINVSPYSDSIVISGSTTITGSDIQNAKYLIADLRNTALSIYNHQGSGVPGIFNTPFVNLTNEINTKIAPELIDTMERISWIIDAAADLEPGNTRNLTFSQNSVIYKLTIMLSADSNHASFIIEDDQGMEIDSGDLVLDSAAQPTSGTFDAIMQTASGNLVASLNYIATVINGSYTYMNFTGSLIAPGLSIDFSQPGRGLSGTFERISGSLDPYDIYPTSIYLSGIVETTTVRMSGTLNASSIVWNQFSEQTMPKNVTFEGSFAELQNGTPTGVLFTGMVQGTWENADTFNTEIDESPSNHPQWNASFAGEISAPSRPLITASLEVKQDSYNALSLSIGYTREETDVGLIFLQGSGTLYLDTEVLIGTLTNQDGLKVIFSYYDDNSGDEKFQGQITLPDGLKLADLYTLYRIPMVKYVDGYIESIF